MFARHKITRDEQIKITNTMVRRKTILLVEFTVDIIHILRVFTTIAVTCIIPIEEYLVWLVKIADINLQLFNRNRRKHTPWKYYKSVYKCHSVVINQWQLTMTGIWYLVFIMTRFNNKVIRLLKNHWHLYIYLCRKLAVMFDSDTATIKSISGC